MIVPNRRDKRSVAIHEAGHLTVALSHGMRMPVKLYGEGDDWDGGGNTHYLAGRKEDDEYFDARVGIAGLAAEALNQHPACTADDVLAALDGGYRLSLDDAALIPADRLERREASADALDTLREHPTFFRLAVERLITEGALDAETAEIEFHKLDR